MKTPAPRCARDGCINPCNWNDSRRIWSKFCGTACAGASRRRVPLEQTVDADRARRRSDLDHQALKRRYEEALHTIERQETELAASRVLEQAPKTFVIEPKHSSKTSEATAVMVASDWHVEERVGAEVGGLNTYSMAIAKTRATRFFQNGLRLIKLLQQDVKISTCVLPLLGDFIGNDIHDESADANEVTPMLALSFAQSLLVSGFEFLLKNSSLTFCVPCHSGNHARTTKKTQFSSENGHSLEFLMYLHLATYFKHEPRISFLIADGMHSYVQIYDQTVRFQHGHAIKYGGGVGGIYVPVNKAIAQWDRARPATLNVFGHFHQLIDGGNFICNGSLIGYNSFALSIKASFEKPKQALFLLDKKRGKTFVCPILLGDK